jgi:hypothetical protein
VSPNIFLFWSPDVGEKHGYYDEFRSDGCFYYTGAGQYGDQKLRDANLQVVNHKLDGREVHLFDGAGRSCSVRRPHSGPGPHGGRYRHLHIVLRGFI